MMKKLLAIALFAVVFAVVAGEKSSIILIGDVHYDPAGFQVEWDKIKGRKRAFETNTAAWNDTIPKILKKAGAHSEKGIDFTVQLGDLVEGNFKDGASHKLAVEQAIARITEHQKVPVYFVRGNHDSAIQGKGRINYNAALQEYYQKNGFKNTTATQVMMHKGDLYIFYSGDQTMALEALEKYPEARHVFFFTHIPVLPSSSGATAWIVNGGSIRNRATRMKLFTALAKRNTIVLSAHIHLTTIYAAKFPEGTITQFSSYSRPKMLSDKISETVEQDGSQFFTKKYLQNPDRPATVTLKEELADKYQPFTKYYCTGGYNVLTADDSGVYVEIYSGKMDKALKRVKLK